MPKPNPLYAAIKTRMLGLMPGGSFEVEIPPDLTPKKLSSFRANVAARVALYRRDLPAGWEFSVRRLHPDRLTITRLDQKTALGRARVAALRAAVLAHDLKNPGPPRLTDPYPLRVQPNGPHLGTAPFDHLSVPRPGADSAAREPHRRALRAALLKLEPGGSFTWPLPPAVVNGSPLATERRWLLRFIDLHRKRFAPDLAVVVGLNKARDGLLVRRRVMVEDATEAA